MVRLITWCVSCLLVLLIAAAPASAQAVSTAQINGTVRDASGGALPGVTVTATQTATGLKRETTTDENGSYVITSLPVGPYYIDASLQGFRTGRITGLVLEVSANPSINITLELGQIEETVSVQGNASLVETRSPGIGQVITNQQVLELPLNGRQLTQLIFLAGEDPKREISIYINSPGGQVYSGLAIYDTMQFISCDIATYCIGMAASMSAVILMAGTKGKRFALPNARVLLHQGSTGFQGAIPDVEVQARESLRLSKTMNGIMALHTGQTEEKMKSDTARDYYLSAEEAREYGVIDHVVTNEVLLTGTAASKP